VSRRAPAPFQGFGMVGNPFPGFRCAAPGAIPPTPASRA